MRLWMSIFALKKLFCRRDVGIGLSSGSFRIVAILVGFRSSSTSFYTLIRFTKSTRTYVLLGRSSFPVSSSG